MFGVGATDTLAEQHIHVVSDLLGQRVQSATRIGGGRNSRVYRVRSESGDVAAKFYFRPTADGRDRLSIEYSALNFLWQQNIRCIPEPLIADPALQVAVYSFVDGSAIDASAVSCDDVDRLVGFARQLKQVAAGPESQMIGLAAEACCSVSGVVNSISERYRRLIALGASGPSYDALRLFLREEFEPALANIDELARRQGSTYDAELSKERRTLSPSDFGFHNALRSAKGGLIFLDFEYFGWDDPAKMLADVLLHPRMCLTGGLRIYMAQLFRAVFGQEREWCRRVATLYPLFGLKWCLILLNEFHPEQLERRRFVDQQHEDSHSIQMRQLNVARGLLASVMREHARFPFWESYVG
ncbi:MAG: phosphotransferase [Acidiferrobacteraceae bacterium]